MADGAGSSQLDWSRRAATLDPRLLLWLSPAFPVGAFAFSHGLEQATARGWLNDANALQAWLRDLVQHGSLHNDLVLLAEAWRRTTNADWTALRDVNELALALQPSAERHLETRTQGNAFMATISAAWPCDRLDAVRGGLSGSTLLSSAIDRERSVDSRVREEDDGAHRDTAYPVAVGAIAAAHHIELTAALTGYALAFASNLVSAAIRLSVIGQTDGQRVLAALLFDLEAAAAVAATSILDDLGSATFRSDLVQLAHETQYSRLFRS